RPAHDHLRLAVLDIDRAALALAQIPQETPKGSRAGQLKKARRSGPLIGSYREGSALGGDLDGPLAAGGGPTLEREIAFAVLVADRSLKPHPVEQAQEGLRGQFLDIDHL